MPLVTSTAPRASKLLTGRVGRPPLTMRKVATSSTRLTGRLTQSTQRQPRSSVKRPPRKTPTAEASPAIAPHAPSAVFRSLPSGKLVVRIYSVAGSIIAAPNPCTSRAPMSIVMLGASAQATEANVKITMPIRKTRRRP